MVRISSCGAEGLGEMVACLLGADEEHALAGLGVGEEGFGEGLGYGLRGDEVGGEAGTGSETALGGGWADGGDLRAWSQVPGSAWDVGRRLWRASTALALVKRSQSKAEAELAARAASREA